MISEEILIDCRKILIFFGDRQINSHKKIATIKAKVFQANSVFCIHQNQSFHLYLCGCSEICHIMEIKVFPPKSPDSKLSLKFQLMHCNVKYVILQNFRYYRLNYRIYKIIMERLWYTYLHRTQVTLYL